ncbi:uncharacterized protein SAPINGB_P000094 [Magnusiomyces paraingens]|uniref:K Homology domain-containing protein n=1 Tax=Magnusiomyces paraingens TaxID=2606893 RepID=A0A5E8AXJ0_9ASCO|nr:uncharacterized protein SAPINGB_P000094 [Saprochaete ingens]VVT43676.1 unnamed protein product [Saprochaete ingens]
MSKRRNSDSEEPDFKRPAVEIKHEDHDVIEIDANDKPTNSTGTADQSTVSGQQPSSESQATLASNEQPQSQTTSTSSSATTNTTAATSDSDHTSSTSEARPTSRLNEEVEASSPIHLRLLVSSKEAVFIIGQHGNTISKIREESGVELKVSEHFQGIKERVVNIKGSCEHVSKAAALITRCLNDEPFDQASTSDAKVFTLKVLIPQALMGAIIGKGGSRFREIESVSAAKLKSREQLMPYSTDKILQIQGVADAIHIAVYYVSTTCVAHHEYLRNNRPIFYNPKYAFQQKQRHRQNYYGSTPPNMMSQGGFTNQYLQATPGSYGMDQRGAPTATYYGYPTQGLQAYNPAAAAVAAAAAGPSRYAAPRPYTSGPPSMGAAMNAAAAAFGRPGGNITNQNLRNAQLVAQGAERGKELKQDVQIPNAYVGSVIGKGGMTINHMRQFSRANIKVNDPIPNSNERTVTVVGLPEANEMAISMINNVIESEKQKNRTRQFNKNGNDSNGTNGSTGSGLGDVSDINVDGSSEPVQNAS